MNLFLLGNDYSSPEKSLHNSVFSGSRPLFTVSSSEKNACSLYQHKAYIKCLTNTKKQKVQKSIMTASQFEELNILQNTEGSYTKALQKSTNKEIRTFNYFKYREQVTAH